MCSSPSFFERLLKCPDLEDVPNIIFRSNDPALLSSSTEQFVRVYHSHPDFDISKPIVRTFESGTSFTVYGTYLVEINVTCANSSERAALCEMINHFASHKDYNHDRKQLILLTNFDTVANTLEVSIRKIIDHAYDTTLFLMHAEHSVCPSIRHRCLNIPLCNHRQVHNNTSLGIFIANYLGKIHNATNKKTSEDLLREAILKLMTACVPVPEIGMAIISYAKQISVDPESLRDVCAEVTSMDHECAVANKSLFVLEYRIGRIVDLMTKIV